MQEGTRFWVRPPVRRLPSQDLRAAILAFANHGVRTRVIMNLNIGSRWMAVTLLALATSVVGCAKDDAATESQDAGESDADMPFDDDGDPTTVTLADGKLKGDLDGDAVRFLKIPYAKPPKGELRWKAPVPNGPWKGVRHEADFASPCPQAPSQQVADGSHNEDCLYLNVWRPNNVEPGAPVMVWFHGGGFTTGSASDLVPTSTDTRWYDGHVFAERHGIVVVTVNYRLGVFGFFAHPALKDEGSPLGNQGLLDQRRSLEWVRDNIEAFGGDPNNVTIFGQSAGAGSVCLQVTSPGSRGLFHRAIGESGACKGLSGGAAANVADDIIAYAADHGCEGNDVLSCLRDKPVSEFVGTDPIIRTDGFDALRANFNFGTVIDGKGGFLPKSPDVYWKNGDVAQVPYILGATFEEAQLYFLNAPVPASEEEYLTEINDTYGDDAASVLEVYPATLFDGDFRKIMTRISTDQSVCGIRDHAALAADAGLDVYLYDFNIDWTVAGGVFGPCHTSEINFVFGMPYMETDAHGEIADVMNAMWANFATTGSPNYDGVAVKWPKFASDNDRRIDFADDITVVKNFRKAECDLWRVVAH